MHAATGVEVPKLIEPRRISWINLALVVGTLIGGWALIGVLINVGKSWSTITGADWGWVAAVVRPGPGRLSGHRRRPRSAR